MQKLMVITPEILTALIGAMAAAAIAIISKISEIKANQKRQQAELEMAFTKAALDFGQFIEEWAETHEEINNLLTQTLVDRFVILRAWNGVDEPKWTTAVLQIRQGKQEPISYVHYDLDRDYVARLRELSVRSTAYYDTTDMPEGSGIRSIYQAEGVTGAMWALLDEQEGPKGSKAISYCSFATHSKGGLCETDLTRCRILVGRLKGVAGNFYREHRPTKR